MPWECGCAQFGGCDATYLTLSASEPLSCGSRVDYPDCHLFVIPSGAVNGAHRVFSSETGALVGGSIASDETDNRLACPSNPQVTGLELRYGTFPDPSCQPVACPDTPMCRHDLKPCLTAAPDGGFN